MRPNDRPPELSKHEIPGRIFRARGRRGIAATDPYERAIRARYSSAYDEEEPLSAVCPVFRHALFIAPFAAAAAAASLTRGVGEHPRDSLQVQHI